MARLDLSHAVVEVVCQQTWQMSALGHKAAMELGCFVPKPDITEAFKGFGRRQGLYLRCDKSAPGTAQCSSPAIARSLFCQQKRPRTISAYDPKRTCASQLVRNGVAWI